MNMKQKQWNLYINENVQFNYLKTNGVPICLWVCSLLFSKSKLLTAEEVACFCTSPVGLIAWLWALHEFPCYWPHAPLCHAHAAQHGPLAGSYTTSIDILNSWNASVWLTVVKNITPIFCKCLTAPSHTVRYLTKLGTLNFGSNQIGSNASASTLTCQNVCMNFICMDIAALCVCACVCACVCRCGGGLIRIKT